MLIAVACLGSNPAFFFTCYNIMDRLYFNMYVSLPSGARALCFDTKLHLLPFCVCVCSKGSGKSVQIRRLV